MSHDANSDIHNADLLVEILFLLNHLSLAKYDVVVDDDLNDNHGIENDDHVGDKEVVVVDTLVDNVVVDNVVVDDVDSDGVVVDDEKNDEDIVVTHDHRFPMNSWVSQFSHS